MTESDVVTAFNARDRRMLTPNRTVILNQREPRVALARNPGLSD